MGSLRKITGVPMVVSDPNPHNVGARKVCNSQHAMAVVITLRPGEALKNHITPVDLFFSVPEGAGVVAIGSEKQTVGKDMPVESPARIPHRWSSESGSVLKRARCQVPKPMEETKLFQTGSGAGDAGGAGHPAGLSGPGPFPELHFHPPPAKS